MLNIFIWGGCWILSNVSKASAGMFMRLHSFEPPMWWITSMWGHLSANHTFLFFIFLLYNSFVRLHFHVCDNTCSFPRTPTFQNPRTKRGQYPALVHTCHRAQLPVCSQHQPPFRVRTESRHSCIPLLAPGVKRTGVSCLHCGGFSVWPAQTRRPLG